MQKRLSTLTEVIQWLIFLARIIIGLTVIWVGYTLISGQSYMLQNLNKGFETGLFLMLIGAYFCFSAFSRQFFDP